MPFKKRATRSRVAKRTYKRKPRTNLRKAVKKIIASSMQVKHTQMEYSTGVTTSAVIQPLVNWPAQGIKAYGDDETEQSSQGQRIGNTIFPKSLVFNYSLAAGDSENFLRITIFQWLMPLDISGEYPIYGDIFTEGSTSYGWLTPFNYDNRTKYRIMYDRCHNLVIGGQQIMNRKMKFLKFPVKKLSFIGDSETGTTAGLVKGNIFICYVSDSTVTPNPTISWVTRFDYTD